MAWYLNRALTNFRDAVNAAHPRRDKTSDGTIGDLAHQATSSSHNPDADGSVDAWDMDVDLRSGRDADAIEELKRVFEAHEASQYWIHDGVIASRSTGWRREPYTGPNRHDKHVHFNSREAFENSPAPWILEDDMPLSGDDISNIWSAKFGAVGARVTAAQMLAEARRDAAAALAATKLVAAAVGGVDEATRAELRADLDRLEDLITAVPAETVEALGDLDTPEQIAERLKAVLGDKAAAVGAILAAG